MILEFTTELKSKPTYFVEKIIKGLIDFYLSTKSFHTYMDLEAELQETVVRLLDYKNPGDFVRRTRGFRSKLHTMRTDEEEIWNQDSMIDFYFNKNEIPVCFAYSIPCVSTQEVFMTYGHSDLIHISIDGHELFGYNERLKFAINDGFDSWDDFFDYFYPKIKQSENQFYKSKLIHWTDLKY